MLHLLFNLIVAAFGIPLAGKIIRLSKLWNTQDNPTRPLYIHLSDAHDRDIALSMSKMEILRISQALRLMLKRSWTGIHRRDRYLCDLAAADDDFIDFLDGEIKSYLSKISHYAGPQLRDQCLEQVRFLSVMEGIGDLIERQLSPLSKKLLSSGTLFPRDYKRALLRGYRDAQRSIVLAEAFFSKSAPSVRVAVVDLTRTHTAWQQTERERTLTLYGQGHSHRLIAIYGELLLCLERIVVSTSSTSELAPCVAYDMGSTIKHNQASA